MKSCETGEGDWKKFTQLKWRESSDVEGGELPCQKLTLGRARLSLPASTPLCSNERMELPEHAQKLENVAVLARVSRSVPQDLWKHARLGEFAEYKGKKQGGWSSHVFSPCDTSATVLVIFSDFFDKPQFWNQRIQNLSKCRLSLDWGLSRLLGLIPVHWSSS